MCISRVTNVSFSEKIVYHRWHLLIERQLLEVLLKLTLKLSLKFTGRHLQWIPFWEKKNSMTSNILWIFWHFSDSYAIEHWRTPAACNFIKKISRLAFSCEFCYTIEHVCSKRPGDRFCFFGFAFCFCSLCFTWIDINRFFTHQKTAPKNLF